MNVENPKSDTVLHVHDNVESLVLVGQAQVLNPATAALEPAYVMLDTGADRSFISNEQADRLQLEGVDSMQRSINTFGPNTPILKTCAITVLKMWDGNGALIPFL
ncbi:hypothetical protein RB195_018970 [Necator americanus]|uniref:Peptidase A2 domain-containing protein n=1 Tax=Necator americanus TaxID=51031 RepID=A0ABR1CBZ2_NECAM